MTKLKTNQLTGSVLDWAVAKCEGHEIESLRGGAVWYWLRCSLTGALETVEVFQPSSRWEQSGPIIERERIDLQAKINAGCDYDEWLAVLGVGAKMRRRYGPTPLVAAMRCYVASKLGNEVEIPDELLKELNG